MIHVLQIKYDLCITNQIWFIYFRVINTLIKNNEKASKLKSVYGLKLKKKENLEG